MISIQQVVIFLNIKQANIIYPFNFFFELAGHLTAINVEFVCVLG